MKKALSIILVFAMLLALTACGNNASQNTQNGSEGNQDATQNETTEAENAEFMPPENYATVLLVTINPQFRLYLDADGNVLAVEAVNKDAKKIAGQLSFETDHYTEAVKKIVTAANENDFIKSTTVIHVEITDTKGSSVDKDEVLNEITTVVNEIAPELKLQVKVKENKPSEGETTIPPQCSHVYEDATCTAPKTCKTCGATDGAANGHNWQDATCTAPKTCKTCGATDGAANGHNWNDATCTAPKTCKTCGATDGAANGHNWNDATCTVPKTCKTCGATDGAANGHSWQDATCTAPKTCKTCGATDGAANGHSWQDATCTAPKACKTCGATDGAANGHDWNDATCTAPKTCKTCGATDGAANGHDWNDATCTAPKTCKTCGATDGAANGHNWNDATCTAPKTCKTCGATDGAANGHNWNDATCTAPKTCKTCGATDGAANGHNWQDATCTAPKTCKTCGATDGAANGHNWNDATCTAPKTCKTCGATEGAILTHTYQNGICSCGARELDVGRWCTYYTYEGTLYKISIGSTGISKTEYMEVEKIPAADLEIMIQYGQLPTLYEGKIYFPRGGLGDPCYFSDKTDNSIVFNLGFKQDAQLGNWTQKMTLERIDLDKITVTKMSEPFYNIKEGTVFVYENETDTTLQNWEGNIWRAAVVTENGNFAMEYHLNTAKKETISGTIGYPLTSRGGPRYDTISSDVLGEYPLTFEVDGVKYGDAGDYSGVEFVTFKAEKNMVIISDHNDVPSIVLCQVNSKQYKVIAHLNNDQNTYPQRCLPVETVFTLVEE